MNTLSENIETCCAVQVQDKIQIHIVHAFAVSSSHIQYIISRIYSNYMRYMFQVKQLYVLFMTGG